MVESLDRKELLEGIAASLADLDSENLRRSIEEALQNRISPQEIIKDGMGKGMEIVGGRYEKGDYFLSELIMAGVAMNEGLALVEPLLKGQTTESKGMVLIGTVEGDLHDIGKNIVATMLKSAEFEVHDLGVDVPPRVFVEKTKELKPDIIALSALLSVTISNVKSTIDALAEVSLRKNIKVLVGGSCLNEKVAKEVGADAFGSDAWDGVIKAKRLTSK
jgi:corrinoid protein of di/trimethylamine methyltransferase